MTRIHNGLVGARALVGTAYLGDPVLRAEYARDIAPRTERALERILRQVFPEPGGRQDPRRVLDLGSGTGAAGAAVRRYFKDRIELVSVDRVIAAAGVRMADITDLPALSRVVGPRRSFEVLTAAHVLNELRLGEAEPNRSAELARLVGRWCEALLADGGTLILIEPALRETSRVLLAVRDQLLAAGLHVVAPCFYTGPCPALVRARDWCHDSVPAEGGGRPVDFSYLVVRSAGHAPEDPSLFRVVSDPLPEKGRLKLFVCGVSGRQALVRLDRHATVTNAGVDQLRRGDIARIARTTFAQDGLRVVADTAVTPSAD